MTWRIGAGSAFRHYLLTGSMASVFVLAACGDDDTAKTLTVADPVADKELTLAVDDTDPDTEGLQYDVQVESSGLVEGTPLILIVDDKQVGQGELGSDGKMTLPGITLEPGQKTIVARTTLAEITSDKEQQYIYRMLRIASPSAGAVDEDADATTDGMQVAVSVEAFAIEGDVILVVDGEEQDDTSAVTEGVASFQVTLTAGSHTLAAKSGDVVSEDVAIFVQRACGSIALVSPKAAKDGRVVLGGADGTCPADGEPYMGTFEVSTDVGNGLTARLFVNDMMAATAKVDGTLATFDDVTLGMRTTASTIKVEVDTAEGTCSKSFDVDVFVDCAGPDCEITSPTPKVVTSGSTTTEYLNSDIGDGTFEVAVASSADLVGRSVSLIVDGNSTDALSEDAVADGSAAKATFDVALADGAHTVRARCVDAAGNVTSSAVKNWTVDVTPCAVALTSPVADATLLLADDEDTGATGTQTLVSATVTGSGCAEARASVCDTGAAAGDYATYASGAPFTVTLDDSTIDQSLCVDVRDVAGNVGSASVAVQYFSAVPTLAIVSPADGAKFNTTGDDSLAEAFEADEDTSAEGCQGTFRVQCSEIGVPVELVRVPSVTGMTEVVLGTADCNAPTASDTDIPTGGVAVFSAISFQDPIDASPSYLARQTYVGDSGLQIGESAGVAVTGQCTALALTYRADARKTGGGITPLTICPARVGTSGVTLDVYVDAVPALQGMVATLTATDANGADVTISNNTATGIGGSFFLNNRGITVGSAPGMAAVSVQVVDTYNNTATTTCDYNVSDSSLDLVSAVVASPPGTTTFTTTTPDNAACSNVGASKFRVPVILTADAGSVTNASERGLRYTVNSGAAVAVPLANSGAVICVEVPEGASNIVARLDDTVSVDFDMELIAVNVDTLNLTSPADSATYAGIDGSCAAGEVRVQATVHPFHANGTTATITTGAGSASATVAGGAISSCVAAAVGAQTVTVSVGSGVSKATQSANITVFADPSAEQAVAMTATPPLTSSATYRTTDVAITWALPSGTFSFTTADMRCGRTALTVSDDNTAWWNALATKGEHLDAKGQSRFAAAAGTNPVSGTYDIPTGAMTAHCALRLCDGGSRCTPIPTASTPISKPFRSVTVSDSGAAEFIGRKIEPVGDVNGDGMTDVLISAPSISGTDAAVYLYFGVSDGNLPTVPDIKISMTSGSEIGGSFGTSIAGIGDVNGDGRPDFAVGRPAAPGVFGPGYGAAYVFFGRDQADPWPATLALDDVTCLADVCINHDDSVDGYAESLGAAIAGLGDFDAAGNDDFVIGAPGTTANFAIGGSAAAPGAAYIISGQGFPTCSNAACSNRTGSHFGFAAMVSPDGSTTSNVTGFFVEGTGLTGVTATTAKPATFGLLLAGVANADASSDGRSDVVIGAGGAQKLFFLAGRAFPSSGTSALALSAASEIALPLGTSSTADSGRNPTAIRLLGNVFDPAGATAGMPDLGVFFNANLGLHVLAGKTSVGFSAAPSDVMYVSGTSSSNLGSTVAGGMFAALPGLPEMDLDGDGETDLFLGSKQTSESGSPAAPGGAYYFPGDAIVRNPTSIVGTTGPIDHTVQVNQVNAATNVAPPVVTTNVTNTAGRAVQYGGDLTGDGVPDLLVGDQVNTSEPKGGFHVLY